MVIFTISPSLVQCPPKVNRMDAIPFFASSLAMVGMGVISLLAKMPCMSITIGQDSVAVLKLLGSVMVMSNPPCGP